MSRLTSITEMKFACRVYLRRDSGPIYLIV